MSCLPEGFVGGRQTITLDQDAVGIERGDGEDGNSRPSERVQDCREDSGQGKGEWAFEPNAGPAAFRQDSRRDALLFANNG